MSRFAVPRAISTKCFANRRRFVALSLAVALAASGANALARSKGAMAARPTSGYGVPAWVEKECRPATGGEIMGRFAGNGYYFYRDSGDYCYFDRRPGVL